MSANFRIISGRINGSSLVLHESGDFDGNSVWERIKHDRGAYDSNGIRTLCGQALCHEPA